jgi:hypothetical protein
MVDAANADVFLRVLVIDLVPKKSPSLIDVGYGLIARTRSAVASERLCLLDDFFQRVHFIVGL